MWPICASVSLWVSRSCPKFLREQVTRHLLVRFKDSVSTLEKLATPPVLLCANPPCFSSAEHIALRPLSELPLQPEAKPTGSQWLYLVRVPSRTVARQVAGSALGAQAVIPSPFSGAVALKLCITTPLGTKDPFTMAT